MSWLSRLVLIVAILVLAVVEGSQCCNRYSSSEIQTKWQLAMKILDVESMYQLMEKIVSDLQANSPITAGVIMGRRAMDPAYLSMGKKQSYLKFMNELGIMLDLITNEDALNCQINHYVLTNHIHYGSELKAIGDAMEAILWNVFQIVDLSPSIWHSCLYEIIYKMQHVATQAVTNRVYARCDISPDTGDPAQPVQGTIVFEQPKQGGSTVIRGKLIGFDKTDSDLVHGFHIHSVGTVANGCFDALKHFNPENMTHGAPYEQARHIGDLGNISEDGDGVADIYMWDHKASLMGDNTVIGHTLMIHESYDSFRRPSTYKGRLGCCVITGMATPGLE